MLKYSDMCVRLFMQRTMHREQDECDGRVREEAGGVKQEHDPRLPRRAGQNVHAGIRSRGGLHEAVACMKSQG